MKAIFIEALIYLADFIRILILIRCVLSWFPINKTNLIFKIIYNLTEPLLHPIRKLINNSPLGRGALFVDFSPFIAILLIHFLEIILINFVYKLF